MPTQNGATKSRCGGMSVSLAGQDGRVVGGGLAGLLVAAGPVQVRQLCLSLSIFSQINGFWKLQLTCFFLKKCSDK